MSAVVAASQVYRPHSVLMHKVSHLLVGDHMRMRNC